MLEKPINSSKQKFVTFSMKEVINSGSEIVLKSGNNNVISFTAKENFKTLILSNSKMNSGLYDLFVNGNKTSYSYTIK